MNSKILKGVLIFCVVFLAISVVFEILLCIFFDHTVTVERILEILSFGFVSAVAWFIVLKLRKE